MSRAEEFIASYHRIEDYLSREMGDGKHFSFSNMVNRLAKHNPIIERYKEDLHQMSQLRNAIVHERREPDFIIAEPHESIVSLILEVEKELLHPRQVIPMFRKIVTTFDADDSLVDVLGEIRDKNYSQFPVYNHDGSWRGLLTKKGVTSWLAETVDGPRVSLEGVQVKHVLHHDPHLRRYRFIAKETSVIEAHHHFINMKDGVRLDALLITETGQEDEPLLGIIRPQDILYIIG
ncbi:CBS domain-containing protein [Exiguobacterium sp. TNDT2]|uniref:CBS domain-containing protein n=1 Tax=Exiguobacterium sp. TNDT2 TaxID=2233531 RepID=UPI000DEFDD2D|nr:CBS domain-containing protein [Exiguobacterium sp. TNDT2]